MLRFSKLFWILGLMPILAWGQQDCSFVIRGQIIDENTKIPLAYATVLIVETNQGTVADSAGFFILENICEGEYHVQFKHIGCETKQFYINIKQDSIFTITLRHYAELLHEVSIESEKSDYNIAPKTQLEGEQLYENAHENLADLLEQVTGVAILKTGSGISKPIINGLSGNRVVILNNGIVQSGQQWGNDHAPEIDAMVADKITVIKGVGTLAYPNQALGGVVLVEANPIKEPHWHGKIQHSFQSNGRGNTTNIRLEKAGENSAFRFLGTFKYIGDRQTANYFLTNTGSREANFALQLDKYWRKNAKTTFFYSLFNTTIGILRGSHIGNLTDLQEAFSRKEPFFTENRFSFNLEAPFQKVQHHLFKIESEYNFNNYQQLKIIYGGQLNDRREFDVRRGGRTERPSLSLQQWTHSLDMQFLNTFNQFWHLQTGVQLQSVDNQNNPETGVLPLIPDYQSYNIAAYGILQYEKQHFLYEIGARYDLRQLSVSVFNNTLPRKIEEVNRIFHNLSFSAGLKYSPNTSFETRWQIAYLGRNPEVNELYSAGLHQGVSGIEEGRATLQNENSLKISASFDKNFGNKFFLQSSFYGQYIENFIYLQPQKEFRLTIRGAFPLFLYEQDNAMIYGIDLTSYYQPVSWLKFSVQYAFIRGENLSQAIPLVNIPSNRLYGSINCDLKDTKVALKGRYVWQQQNLLPEQDFLTPPPAYFLIDFEASHQWEWAKNTLKVFTQMENFLNTSYRDYLNRQRYFADELGRNIVVGLRYSF